MTLAVAIDSVTAGERRFSNSSSFKEIRFLPKNSLRELNARLSRRSNSLRKEKKRDMEETFQIGKLAAG
jgi:hypothetical protein